MLWVVSTCRSVHMMFYRDCIETCMTLLTCIVLLTNVTQINSIKKKKRKEGETQWELQDENNEMRGRVRGFCLLVVRWLVLRWERFERAQLENTVERERLPIQDRRDKAKLLTREQQ